jgi:hypothetical protein
VDDQVLMGVGNGAANLPKKLEPFIDRELTLLGVTIDPMAFDVLHHEVGHSVLGGSAVEQARDVRVFERSKNLPFMLEAPEDGVRIHPAFDQLDGDLHLELLVRALGEENRAHPARSDALEQFVLTDHPPCF